MADNPVDAPFRVLVCDCEGTNPIDLKTIARGTGDPALSGSQLCRRQVDGFRAELGGDGPLLVGCTQEAPLFLELAGEAGFDGALRFVNIREKAGWAREGDRAGAKMAALIAEAMLDVGGPGTVTLSSDGVVLVLGRNDVALEAAQRLGRRMDVTLLLDGKAELTPPRTAEVPLFQGSVTQARGHLGAFELHIDGYAPARPAARDNVAFAAAGGEAAVSRCDIVLDLRGGTPLFPAPEKRDGYFNPDPRDPAAVARALFEITDLVGEFEKPRYVEYDAAICAHGRSGIAGCTRCLDNCPTGAIASTGETVAIDPFVCAGCGNCAGVCPTGAVRYTMPESDMVLMRLRTLLSTYRAAGGRDAALLLHDGGFGEDMIDALARHGDGLPANVVPVAVNETGQCGLETLLAARVFGARATAVLASPRTADELASVDAAAALSNHILAALGYDDGRAELIVADDPDVVAARLQTLATAQSDDAAPAAFHPVGRKRTLLQLALSALHAAAPAPVDEIALPDGAPFGTVDVDVDNCTLCLACVGACPANALRDDPDHPRLSFVETACVQCGLCARTCPEKVISLRPRLDFTGRARNPRTIKEEQPFECIRCGTPFATQSMIRSVMQRMSSHAMFADEQALNRLQMCADCRVIDMAEAGQDPMAAGERPRPRTTDDYLRARERGLDDDDDLA